MAVLMVVIATVAVGTLMGLKFKVPALIAATALLLVGTYAWNGLGLPGDATVTRFLILSLTLAGAYLVGLSIRMKWDEGSR